MACCDLLLVRCRCLQSSAKCKYTHYRSTYCLGLRGADVKMWDCYRASREFGPSREITGEPLNSRSWILAPNWREITGVDCIYSEVIAPLICGSMFTVRWLPLWYVALYLQRGGCLLWYVALCLQWSGCPYDMWLYVYSEVVASSDMWLYVYSKVVAPLICGSIFTVRWLPLWYVALCLQYGGCPSDLWLYVYSEVVAPLICGSIFTVRWLPPLICGSMFTVRWLPLWYVALCLQWGGCLLWYVALCLQWGGCPSDMWLYVYSEVVASSDMWLYVYSKVVAPLICGSIFTVRWLPLWYVALYLQWGGEEAEGGQWGTQGTHGHAAQHPV